MCGYGNLLFHRLLWTLLLLLLGLRVRQKEGRAHALPYLGDAANAGTAYALF